MPGMFRISPTTVPTKQPQIVTEKPPRLIVGKIYYFPPADLNTKARLRKPKS